MQRRSRGASPLARVLIATLAIYYAWFFAQAIHLWILDQQILQIVRESLPGVAR